MIELKKIVAERVLIWSNPIRTGLFEDEITGCGVEMTVPSTLLKWSYKDKTSRNQGFWTFLENGLVINISDDIKSVHFNHNIPD